ncbi:MAG: tRNA (5-methylaminomethyl-2-thiouridine)(34)-methyltransferase MnmD [Spirochaetales bacterium]|nr:tRNA (5-methylaminomethyl-2-thiouridine)(34)-methyltransferase MnmD [Spirochaetales bacterium]
MIQEQVPFNPTYDDWYFSPGSGYDESLYVFYEGNEISSRFSPAFRVGEIGFGTGLNLWVLLHELSSLGISGSLDFRTVDEAPPKPRVVEQILHPYIDQLGGPQEHSRYLDYYQSLTSEENEGWHSVDLEIPIPIEPNQPQTPSKMIVSLALWRGEASDMVTALQKEGWLADGWFLDGHDPKKNPKAWSDELLKTLARCTKVGGTLATYSAAGRVKTGLREVGFEVRRRKGFGTKRHMVQGWYRGTGID